MIELTKILNKKTKKKEVKINLELIFFKKQFKGVVD